VCRKLSLIFKRLHVGGKSVFDITVAIARSEQGVGKPERPHTQKPTVLAAEGERQKTGMSAVFTLLHRVAPVAGLAVALFATVAWIGIVGYALIKLL
jgi:hypothetical protein